MSAARSFDRTLRFIAKADGLIGAIRALPRHERDYSMLRLAEIAAVKT
jgi:hypothetical protein